MARFFSGAKINLGLRITEKRADGYHNLESAFYPIQWQDCLDFELSSSDRDVFINSGIEVPGGLNNNLIGKALGLLREQFKLPALSIHLDKNVPFGAGLGAGSSNAAVTLMAVNQFLGLGISDAALTAMAEKLGADCAFFIKNEPVYASGIGTDFQPIDLSFLKGKWVQLVWPGFGVGTAWAYSNIKPEKPETDTFSILKEPHRWRAELFNDFERPVFKNHPELSYWKEAFYHKGAFYASMSGSGSSVFGLFDAMPNPINSAGKGGYSFTGRL